MRDAQVMASRLTDAVHAVPADWRSARSPRGSVRSSLPTWPGHRGRATVRPRRGPLTGCSSRLDRLVDGAPVRRAGRRWVAAGSPGSERRPTTGWTGRSGNGRGGTADDPALHEARKAYKRALYAVEVVEPTVGIGGRPGHAGSSGCRTCSARTRTRCRPVRRCAGVALRAYADGENTFSYGLLYARQAHHRRPGTGRARPGPGPVPTRQGTTPAGAVTPPRPRGWDVTRIRPRSPPPLPRPGVYSTLRVAATAAAAPASTAAGGPAATRSAATTRSWSGSANRDAPAGVRPAVAHPPRRRPGRRSPAPAGAPGRRGTRCRPRPDRRPARLLPVAHLTDQQRHRPVQLRCAHRRRSLRTTGPTGGAEPTPDAPRPGHRGGVRTDDDARRREVAVAGAGCETVSRRPGSS